MNSRNLTACVASMLLAMSPAAFSQRVPSFGPNGTHWPANTPKPGDDIPHVVEVTCTWAAIKSAIVAATDAQVNAGLHIKVAPGVLPGYGAGSGSTPAIRDAGKTGLSKNILITPRDGWGTVTISDAARILNIKGVTFARFNGVYAFLHNCPQTNWAQSKLSKGFRMQASGTTVTNCNVYEVVIPDAQVTISDPMGFASGDGDTIKDCVIEGLYCAPAFRPTGASDHVDAIQMYGNGFYRGLTIKDSVIFGAMNCALQLGGMKATDPGAGTMFATIDHTILTSLSKAMAVRYPLPPGAQAPSLGQAINGIGEDWQLYASDSYVFGTMYTTKWGAVTNSKSTVAAAATQYPANSGGWVYDAAVAAWGAADFDAIAPVLSDAYLADIWSDNPPTPPIAYDGFNYATTTAINTAADSSTDIGWTGTTWSGTNDVIAPGLTYSNYPSEGNAVQFTSSIGAVRSFDASLLPAGSWVIGSDGIKRLGATGSTIWIAFLIRSDMADADGTKNASLSLLGSGTGGTNKLAIGDTGTNANWSVTKGSTTSSSASPIVDGAVTLLVARIKFISGSNNDEVDLFVNPAVGAAAPSTPSAMLRGIDIGAFDRVEFKGNRKSTGDELAVGIDWSSVTGQ